MKNYNNINNLRDKESKYSNFGVENCKYYTRYKYVINKQRILQCQKKLIKNYLPTTLSKLVKLRHSIETNGKI